MLTKSATVVGLVVAAAVLAGCNRQAPEPAAGRADASWTGESRPHDVIVARQELMGHIEELMEPIDLLTVGRDAPAAQLQQNAEVIGAMLTALPHLFPPTTDRYDPQSTQPETIALPAIWKDFDAFYALAKAAVDAAGRMAEASAGPGRAEASRALRASCEGCHALFLRKYVPPKVLDSDREFDFGKALPGG